MGVSFIQVKHVPTELHDAVRRRAAEEGMTVSDYVLGLLQRDLALPSRRAWFERLSERQPVDLDDDAVTHAIHSERPNHRETA
jgi:antitoxin FitA